MTGPLLSHPTTTFLRGFIHLGWILGIAYVASLATDREPLAMLIVVLLADHCFQHARMSTNASWRLNGWDKC